MQNFRALALAVTALAAGCATTPAPGPRSDSPCRGCRRAPCARHAQAERPGGAVQRLQRAAEPLPCAGHLEAGRQPHHAGSGEPETTRVPARRRPAGRQGMGPLALGEKVLARCSASIAARASCSRPTGEGAARPGGGGRSGGVGGARDRGWRRGQRAGGGGGGGGEWGTQRGGSSHEREGGKGGREGGGGREGEGGGGGGRGRGGGGGGGADLGRADRRAERVRHARGQGPAGEDRRQLRIIGGSTPSGSTRRR